MIQLKDTPTQVYAIGVKLFFIKGAPRSASKLSIDPINSHTSYFGKSTGSNKRSVPINRTVSSNRSRRVIELPEIFAILLIFGLLPPHVRDVFRGLSEDLRAARFVTL